MLSLLTSRIINLELCICEYDLRELITALEKILIVVFASCVQVSPLLLRVLQVQRATAQGGAEEPGQDRDHR
jgi:hypothetical protein